MSILEEAKSILKIQSVSLEQKYKQVHELAWKIFVKYNEYPQSELNFYRFIYSWNIFYYKGIAFELWSDICKEGLELLAKLLEDPSIPYEQLPDYKEFKERRDKRSQKIQKMPDYSNRFTMDAYN